MRLKPWLGAILLPGALLTAPEPAAAQASNGGDIHVIRAWSRPTAAGALTAVGYLRIMNHGAKSDSLIAASSSMARKVEVHRSTMAGGVMRMETPKAGLPIGPGETIILAPGGDHLMLVGPTRAFRLGDLIPVTLRFRRAGRVNIQLQVDTASVTPDSAMQEHQH